jgi:hypothetical protein
MDWGPAGPQPTNTRRRMSERKQQPTPSWEEDLERLTAELKATEEERSALYARLREKFMPDIEELIDFAHQCNHQWAKDRTADEDAEHVTREVLLMVLYSRSEERNRIKVVDSEIEALRAKIRETKKMVRFFKEPVPNK